MIDDDEIEEKEIDEEIAELMKGQGMGAKDAAVEAPENSARKRKKPRKRTKTTRARISLDSSPRFFADQELCFKRREEDIMRSIGLFNNKKTWQR